MAQDPGNSASSPASCSSFPKFSLLPPEIRLEIWSLACTATLRQALSVWLPECRRTRRCLPTDKHYNHVVGGDNQWEIEFIPENASKIVHEMPLVFVNSEARDAALSWARERGITHSTSIRPGGRNGLFLRPFDMELDVLLVDSDEFTHAYSHEYDYVIEEAWMGADHRYHRPDGGFTAYDWESVLKRIAFDYEWVFDSRYCFNPLFPCTLDHMRNLEVLYVVMEKHGWVQESWYMAENPSRLEIGYQPWYGTVQATNPRRYRNSFTKEIPIDAERAKSLVDGFGKRWISSLSIDEDVDPDVKFDIRPVVIVRTDDYGVKKSQPRTIL